MFDVLGALVPYCADCFFKIDGSGCCVVRGLFSRSTVVASTRNETFFFGE